METKTIERGSKNEKMIPSLNGNWVDLIIIVILFYYISVAFRYGLWSILIDFVSFLGSLLISLKAYQLTSNFLKANFNLPVSLNSALGFIITAIVLEVALGYLLTYFVRKLPKKILHFKYNKLLAVIPALGEGLLLVSFILTSVVALPVKPEIKKAVQESKIGGLIIKETSGIESAIDDVFGGAINDTLTYFTVEPKSGETIKLNNGIDHVSVDKTSESQMFADVNKERTSRGIPALSLSASITGVAEAYAMDMWVRGYFSHYNPEGKTVADRLTAAHISWQVTGENLALAPTEQTAMTGLMNSPGHKANILDKEFHKIGIGVVDNGIYGKIFVQEFTN